MPAVQVLRVAQIVRVVGSYRDHNIELIVASEQHFHRLISQPSRFPDKAGAFQALLAETCVRYAVGPEDAQVLLLDPYPC